MEQGPGKGLAFHGTLGDNLRRDGAEKSLNGFNLRSVFLNQRIPTSILVRTARLVRLVLVSHPIELFFLALKPARKVIQNLEYTLQKMN